MKAVNSIYYTIKPILPRPFQLWIRRRIISMKMKSYSNTWPILETAGTVPENWVGWPGGKKFSVVLTHDVETQIGHDRCWKVLEMEKDMGFKSSFNFVPERYEVSSELRQRIEEAGFEVGVHGLNHDGKLFRSYQTFKERAININKYIADWGVVGFRAPAMHHNLKWIQELNIDYDLSTFDTDPFEPQSDGVGTIFPFWVSSGVGKTGYVEMPYTLAQDFTPFVLMKNRDIKVWRDKIDWIVGKGGMVLVNTHPDYFGFDENELGFQEFPIRLYHELLKYLQQRYKNQYWLALPREVASFWKKNMIAGKAYSETN